MGVDNYYSLVTERIVRGNNLGPVTMETKLGWVLSGPIDEVSENLNSHFLKIDATIINERDLITQEVKKFCDNETVGIKNDKPDQDVSDKFQISTSCDT